MKKIIEEKIEAIKIGVISAIYLFLTILFIQINLFGYTMISKIPFLGKIIAFLIFGLIGLKILMFFLSQLLLLFSSIYFIFKDFKLFYKNSFNIYIGGLFFVLTLMLPFLLKINWAIYNITTSMIYLIWGWVSPLLLLLTLVRGIHYGILKIIK